MIEALNEPWHLSVHSFKRDPATCWLRRELTISDSDSDEFEMCCDPNEKKVYVFFFIRACTQFSGMKHPFEKIDFFLYKHKKIF